MQYLSLLLAIGCWLKFKDLKQSDSVILKTALNQLFLKNQSQHGSDSANHELLGLNYERPADLLRAFRPRL